MQQEKLFDKPTFEYVPSIIGSGYEKLVADLAVRDGVAYRAARRRQYLPAGRHQQPDQRRAPRP